VTSAPVGMGIPFPHLPLTLNQAFFLDLPPCPRVFQPKKVKASHTHYRVLGPELIPVYRKSARR